MLLTSLSAAVSPIWGEWSGARSYTYSLVILGLLVSPGMRRYVGAYWPRHDDHPGS
jgi:hypothetical protein